ncbi:hypothetical protein CU098_011863, partial [Rhizopus stolonifer]
LGKSSTSSIQTGPHTSHFTPTQNASIYLDVASIKKKRLVYISYDRSNSLLVTQHRSFS